MNGQTILLNEKLPLTEREKVMINLTEKREIKCMLPILEIRITLS
jgi:hypothetical protein